MDVSAEYDQIMRQDLVDLSFGISMDCTALQCHEKGKRRNIHGSLVLVQKETEVQEYLYQSLAIFTFLCLQSDE